ncbi:hypothetical protein D3C81_2086980 [compost metagenome]
MIRVRRSLNAVNVASSTRSRLLTSRRSAKPICAWAMVWVRCTSACAASTNVMMPSRM